MYIKVNKKGQVIPKLGDVISMGFKKYKVVRAQQGNLCYGCAFLAESGSCPLDCVSSEDGYIIFEEIK